MMIFLKTKEKIHKGKIYLSLIRRWTSIFLKRSYYHVPQPVGKYFSRYNVGGYYNDLTRKVDWKGEVDKEGIPVNFVNGNKIYFPVTIAQMALGSYDLWLETRNTKYRDIFLNCASWLIKNQDQEGGWDSFSNLGLKSLTPYSAMTQGEAISVLTRAFLLTENEEFLEGAKKSFNLLIKPVMEGGCSFYENNEVFLEELPVIPRNTILNGWVFSIFGIYDLWLVLKDNEIKNIMDHTIRSLERNLKFYDSGYWSYYDIEKNLASPFYHNLHIALLDALYRITDIETFGSFSKKWKSYGEGIVNKTRALIIKAYQKLRTLGVILE
jgi:heparosan-N-sulfate-glucuronate 5-epimerase